MVDIEQRPLGAFEQNIGAGFAAAVQQFDCVVDQRTEISCER